MISQFGRLLLASLICLICLIWTAPPAVAADYHKLVTELELQGLLPSFTADKSQHLLMGEGQQLAPLQRRAAALLVSVGALQTADLRDPESAHDKAAVFVNVMRHNHASLLGRIGDAAVLAEMQQPISYADLLSADDFLQVLGKLVADGTLTGYDLRQRGIYDAIASPYWFVYSHSSRHHLRQLIALLHSESIGGWVSMTAKISAYLFREGWGEARGHLATLADNVRVVQAEENAALFQFDSAADQQRFQQVVTRYAKRDSASEQGLIDDAWWQPFYYTSDDTSDRQGAKLPGFQQITMVVVSSEQFEATLTLLNSNVNKVLAALDDQAWTVRVEQIRVNPAFFRFLNGDFK